MGNSITNPTNLVDIQLLNYFEGKLAAKYQTQAIATITGMDATTVEGALAELLGKIQAIPSAIIPKGTRTFSQLAPATDLVAGCLGFMWNISDAFTTTADFVEGAGKAVAAGSNVYVVNVGTAAEPSYKYDIFAGPIDLSGYALKSEMAIADVAGDATKKEITLKSGLSQQVVVAHQDISGKADKDTDAVAGNFASFDANGNPVDSGKKAADFQPAGDYKTTQTAVADPTASGTALAFIDSISQNANGEITVTKKNVKVGSTSDIDEIFA